jgi:hypothetical protein
LPFGEFRPRGTLGLRELLGLGALGLGKLLRFGKFRLHRVDCRAV